MGVRNEKLRHPLVGKNSGSLSPWPASHLGSPDDVVVDQQRRGHQLWLILHQVWTCEEERSVNSYASLPDRKCMTTQPGHSLEKPSMSVTTMEAASPP